MVFLVGMLPLFFSILPTLDIDPSRSLLGSKDARILNAAISPHLAVKEGTIYHPYAR